MARFASRFAEHRIVLKGARQIYGRDQTLISVEPGKTIEFSQFEYHTEDEEEITALRKIIERSGGREITEISESDVLPGREPVQVGGMVSTDRIAKPKRGKKVIA